MAYKKEAVSKHRFFTWFAIMLFSGLLIVSLWAFWKNHNAISDVVLHSDIEKLRNVFDKIHKDCYILDFKHVKNHIDFLNVIHFVGSEIGSMNLAFAKNWQGPYLKNNPKFHEKLYAILKNRYGYFIIPADGVVLSNGKQIGVDIVLDENTDMQKMMHSTDGLLSQSGMLAAPIQVGSKKIAPFLQDPVLVDAID